MALALLAATWGAQAQAGPQPNEAKTSVMMPPTPLLQSGGELLPASAGQAVPEDSSEALAVLKEDGLTRSEAGVKNGGWVKAYQFGDATGALAAYTYLRGAAPHPVRGARVNDTDMETADGERVFLSGTSVVRAQLKPAADALLARINVGLPKVGGRRALPPLLPTLFPLQVNGSRLDSASMRYALGPVGYQAMGGTLPAGLLGWDKSAEVAVANYAGKGSKGALTLLLYPTPQIAGDRGRAVEKAINDQGVASFGTVKMRRVGPLVGVTSGGFAPEQAQALVTALRLNEEVSLDKPMPLEFHAEVRKTATLLQSIAIFTGVLILAALVIGVFLGGARAGIRVLRGKPAASEPEFLTIDLRDRPKALFAPKNGSAEDPLELKLHFRWCIRGPICHIRCGLHLVLGAYR